MSKADGPEDVSAPNSGASPGARLFRDLALYTLARIALVLVITLVIVGVGALFGASVPTLLAVLIALIIAMPLSLWLFQNLRSRVNADLAVVEERRRRDKAQLRARLRGDAEPVGAEPDDAAAGGVAGVAAPTEESRSEKDAKGTGGA